MANVESCVSLRHMMMMDLCAASRRFDFTGADFKSWTEEAGFKKVEIVPLAGPASAAIAYK